MIIRDKMYLSSKIWTKATSFLLPALGVNTKMMDNAGFLNCYLGDRTEGSPTLKGRHLYICFVPDLSEAANEFIANLKTDDLFVMDYMTADEHLMLVFKFPEVWSQAYDKFCTGNYSKMDRNYVKTYFKPKLFKGRDEYGSPIWELSKNWSILNADSIIKKQIEDDLDVKLPEGAEVFSKPNENEYYHAQKPIAAE